LLPYTLSNFVIILPNILSDLVIYLLYFRRVYIAYKVNKLRMSYNSSYTQGERLIICFTQLRHEDYMRGSQGAGKPKFSSWNDMCIPVQVQLLEIFIFH